jgi:ABC-type transport system involved in multi-copper enzyme maturation permease subunit
MAINPVFLNELRQSAFRRRGTVIVTTLVVVSIVLVKLAEFDPLRSVVIYAPLILLPFLVPAVASGAFAKEYEQQTWMDLYLTRLTNAQVVFGKFGAYFVQVAAALIAFMPSLLLMLLTDYSRRLSDLKFGVVPLDWQLVAVALTFAIMLKLFASACFYIMLAMVCSRYSPNRSTALTSSYITIGLYTFFAFAVLSLMNQLTDMASPMAPAERMLPGFMESVHFLFCSVAGFGSLLLVWVSMGEQRGYRNSEKEQITRAWQPAARRSRSTTT